MIKWRLETQVDDWVRKQLERLGLVDGQTFNVQSNYSDALKQALKGASKTVNKAGNGTPDFTIEAYDIPVIVESKRYARKLVSTTPDGNLKLDKSGEGYAVNEAVGYSQKIISTGLYNEVIAIGVAGDSEDDVAVKVYYVHSAGLQPKLVANVESFDFLESKQSFQAFLDDVKITEKERHQILTASKADLNRQAKALNRLMNNHSINVEQRVVYVSGCLLAMQDIIDPHTQQVIHTGLTPDKLTGNQSDAYRDGALIVSHIKDYIEKKNVPANRVKLLMSTFENSIAADTDRDKLIAIDKEVGKLFTEAQASLNKQVFKFVYDNVYQAIDGTNGHLDIMGEMYSAFLKYALGDGKEIGIVLTPPYITKMMVEILKVNPDSRVMDLATGSAGFLISSMTHMMTEVERKYGKGTTASSEKIRKIQEEQLLGVELDAKMYALATTNMLLRGNSSTTIEKGSSFDGSLEHKYKDFNADRLLLNPPFSYEGNGMPFLELGLNTMQKHGLAAIIVQDSAGSGKATAINKRILKKHRLMASIKMPGDLFQPSAGVQTSIYVFEAGVPHDYEEPVKFIDFRNDGYKRTGRGLLEVDSPEARYEDILKIYKQGLKADLPEEHVSLWNLGEVYIEDTITDSGNDWNFEHHQKVNTVATSEDFLKTVGDYMAWEVTSLLNKPREKGGVAE